MQSPKRLQILVLLDDYLRFKAARFERIESELEPSRTYRITHEIAVVLRGAAIPEPALGDMAKRLTDLFFQLRRDGWK